MSNVKIKLFVFIIQNVNLYWDVFIGTKTRFEIFVRFCRIFIKFGVLKNLRKIDIFSIFSM